MSVFKSESDRELGSGNRFCLRWVRELALLPVELSRCTGRSIGWLKAWLAVCAVALCLSQTGCLLLVAGGAAAAGAGTYAYVSGDLKGTESAPLDRVWTATQAAVTELQLPITSRQKDALGARLLARTSSDKKVDIRLKKLTDTSTEIRIRVGTWGDESVSRLILEKIKKRL
jgi:hypothetical protein